jgi:hypothetical protein
MGSRRTLDPATPISRRQDQVENALGRVGAGFNGLAGGVYTPSMCDPTPRTTNCRRPAKKAN